MSDSAQHLSDEVILRFIDNELPAEDVTHVYKHLSSCPACRDRQFAMESTSNALDELYGFELPKVNSSGMEPRTHLQTKLKESRQTCFWRGGLVNTLSFRIAIVAALVVVLMVPIFRGAQGRKFWYVVGTAKTRFLVPDHSLTPGAVRPVTLAEICSANDSDLDPEVSPSIEKAVLDEYGIHPERYSRDYQIDYLVNPQLGGTSDISNLWPEPYSNSKWNAHAKDDLERRLHQMVCAGTLNLAVAQREIAADWISAYKRYIGDQRS
jgi:putative zinc finger protein